MEVLLFCKRFPEDPLTEALTLRCEVSPWDQIYSDSERDYFKIVATFVIGHVRRCSLKVGTTLKRLMKAFSTYCFVEGIHVEYSCEKLFRQQLLKLGLYARHTDKNSIYYGCLLCEEFDFYCK